MRSEVFAPPCAANSGDHRIGDRRGTGVFTQDNGRRQHSHIHVSACQSGVHAAVHIRAWFHRSSGRPAVHLHPARKAVGGANA
eukprot:CAMPEP_0171997286 /NCGR_PEP_ID=MMETSP1041-20130122/600_1 /TAXON_ID=464988 /ORGANISM="Hemiselmis andersenii, Strain CCMP439" /LENGTH=82 /DNA_ID=CAMNT_0012650539 /DNA_START=500 /DNA_END=748 /DNA_ORIENTATION=+